MARTKRGQLIATINMVPFIDIVLVLLIVFMLVTPIVTTQHVLVELPRVSSQSNTPTQKNQWILSINKEGKMFLDRGTAGSKESANRPISRKDIQFLVRSAKVSMPDLTMFIRADRSLPYGQVIEVMSVFQEVGFNNVGLITENP